MTNTESIIERFKNNYLNIDCKKMVLKKRRKNNEYFSGKGYICQEKNGCLTFKIYVTESNIKPLSNIDELSGGVSGKLLQSDDLYDLEAVDVEGIQWSIKEVFPLPSWDITDPTDITVIVTGGIHAMTGRLNIHCDSPYLRLHFFGEYKVPLNRMSAIESRGNKQYVRDHAEFEACGAQFEINQIPNSGETIIKIMSPTELPESFDLRVQESFQYITAKPAFWQAMVESRQNELYLCLTPNRKKSLSTRFNPPIHPAYSEFQEYGWALFSLYLSYVTKNTAGTYWNPVAYHLYNACEATSTSLDSSAVGLSVAVEAVSNLVVLDEQNKNQELADFQHRIRAWLKQQTDVSENIAKRVTGTINGMTNKRPQDTLFSLAAAGKVQKEYIKSWTKIRNKHVHPKPKDLNIPTQADTQNLLDEINKIQVLLWQITFFIIGYDGYFTDYGTHSFPSIKYPLS